MVYLVRNDDGDPILSPAGDRFKPELQDIVDNGQCTVSGPLQLELRLQVAADTPGAPGRGRGQQGRLQVPPPPLHLTADQQAGVVPEKLLLHPLDPEHELAVVSPVAPEVRGLQHRSSVLLPEDPHVLAPGRADLAGQGQRLPEGSLYVAPSLH